MIKMNPKGKISPVKFRPTRVKLDDVLNLNVLDDTTRRLLMEDVRRAVPVQLTPTNSEDSEGTEDERQDSVSSASSETSAPGGEKLTESQLFMQRLEACSRGYPVKLTPQHANHQYKKKKEVKMEKNPALFPSQLRSTVQHGSEDLLTAMAARLKELEKTHTVYQKELKEMQEKFRNTNSMFQKARALNEQHESTIVTLYEEKQELEQEVQRLQNLCARSGLDWKGSGCETTERTNVSTSEGGKSEEDGHCGEGKTNEKMSEKEANALLSGSVSRHAVLDAPIPPAQPSSLYSRNCIGFPPTTEDGKEAVKEKTANADTSLPCRVLDVKRLQRNAEILSDYVGFKEVVLTPDDRDPSRNKSGRIQDREVVRVVLYKNGICVNSGIFRPFGKPLCETFLADLEEGFYPSEFKDKYPDGYPITITDKQDELCDPNHTVSNSASHSRVWEEDGSYQTISADELLKKLPTQRVTPSGRIVDVQKAIAELLGKEKPSAANPTKKPSYSTAPRSGTGHHAEKLVVPSSESSPPIPSTAASLDSVSRGSLISVHVRTPSGETVTIHLQSTDAIAVLRNEFMKAAPEFFEKKFELCQSYPPVTFTSHQKTLAEYGMTRSSTLMVKLL